MSPEVPPRSPAAASDAAAPELGPLLDDLGDPAIVADVVLAYLQQLSERCAALLDGSERGDTGQVATVAHAMAPATAFVGYPGIAEQLREIEWAPGDTARVRWVVERLRGIAGPLERAAAALLGS
jgi:hypothetical protein